MRILVTGSRDWDDAAAIDEAIKDATQGISWHKVTIVVGDCPTGADRLADQWALEREVDVERHRAAWNTYGRAAGPIRNLQMVNCGADLCLAFIRNGSRGASGCADYAEAKGILVRRFTA
ncbi:DUF2493 domain-containing protein [Trebonia kvetii]|uniref:DUF2493 domain-containing protein n=1 Tax=Trebonia kvetii TaxID=2480626 RepID=A0A6P2BSM2_9ACTN|nr:SLOG family protein [Trebonia kvetii]TVZ01226.1 DUF2493 domain-containing protein [Trebonia kvetii]